MDKWTADEILESGVYFCTYGDGKLSRNTYFFDKKLNLFRLEGAYFVPMVKVDDWHFFKAEPPKVCRWTTVDESPSIGVAGCKPDAAADYIEDFTYCPYCGGQIDIAESEG